MSEVQIRMNSNDSKQEQERVLYKDEAQQWNQNWTTELSAEGE